MSRQPLSTTGVKAFFDRVASDRDTMRIAYCDERVVDRLSTSPGASSMWPAATSMSSPSTTSNCTKATSPPHTDPSGAGTRPPRS